MKFYLLRAVVPTSLIIKRNIKTQGCGLYKKKLAFLFTSLYDKYIDFSPQNLSIYPPNGSEKEQGTSPCSFLCLF